MIKGILNLQAGEQRNVVELCQTKSFMLRVLAILFICILFSCKKSDSGDCTPDQYAYEFFSSSKIDTLTNDAGLFFQVNEGNDLVFVYSHTGPECKSVWDEEYTDKLVFQVPSASNSFYYQNDQLTDALCLFRRIDMWSDGSNRIRSGYIKGTRVSATKWDIEINVQAGNPVGQINLKKSFVLH